MPQLHKKMSLILALKMLLRDSEPTVGASDDRSYIRENST
jgi:hypothetical protein